MKRIEYILNELISESVNVISEQSDNNSVFTNAEERFLGMFDKMQTNYLGILYSTSDAGVREFMSRAGASLNLNPQVLMSLIKNNVVKIVPYDGYGRNTDYTIKLNLNLSDIAGLATKADADDETTDNSASSDTTSSSSSGGGFSGGGMTTSDLDTGTNAEAPTDELAADLDTTAEVPEEVPTEEPEGELPDLETAGYMPYGDIIRESAYIAKQLLAEKKTVKGDGIKIYDDESRLLNRLPKGYVYQLKRIIEMLAKKSNSVSDKERIVADILDNLQINFDLKPKHITKAYEFHKNQKRLQKYINDK